MLVLIYTGDDQTSMKAQNILQHLLKCEILTEDSKNQNDFLINGKAVLIIKDLSEWKHYEKFSVILLIIFSEHSNAKFYQEIVEVNKFSYKIRYLNALNDLNAQISGLSFNCRPSWVQYFMDLAVFASYRSSCKKRNVGAIIVKDRRIISTGFNGTPVGTPNCIDGGCLRCNSNSKTGEGLDLCFCLHAEESAILGQPKELTIGSTMYVSLFPCWLCLKKIIQSGIQHVIYKENYCENDTKLIKILEKSNVMVEKFERMKI